MSAPSTAAGIAATIAGTAAVVAAVLVAQSDQGKEVAHAVQEDIHRALAPPTLSDKADNASAAVSDLVHSSRVAAEDAAHAAANHVKATVHQAVHPGPSSMHHTSLFTDSPLVRAAVPRAQLRARWPFLPPTTRTHSPPQPHPPPPSLSRRA